LNTDLVDSSRPNSPRYSFRPKLPNYQVPGLGLGLGLGSGLGLGLGLGLGFRPKLPNYQVSEITLP